MKYGGMNNVAAWISDDMLENIECFRWPARMSRSTFIRKALQFYLDSIKEGMKDNQRQIWSNRGIH